MMEEDTVTEQEIGDKNLELAETGPITDLETLKCVAEAIEAAKSKTNTALNMEVNKEEGDSLVEENELTIDDSVVPCGAGAGRILKDLLGTLWLGRVSTPKVGMSA